MHHAANTANTPSAIKGALPVDDVADESPPTLVEVVVVGRPACVVVGAFVVGGDVVDTVSVGMSEPSCAAVTCVYDAASGFPRPGVGSKATQPMPSNHTSGHAWACRPYTWNRPSAPATPGVNPTATRAGIPSVRAITANVAENC